MLYIKVCKWERESSDIGPESLKMWCKKKVITFEKVIVWQFDRFCILGLLSGSLLTSIATIPIPPPTSTAVALLFDLYTKWDSCDPNISGILWKSWGLFTPYYEAVARHIQCPESALLFSTQPQPSVNSSTNPNPLLSTLSGSFNFDTVITVIPLLQLLQGCSGFCIAVQML